MKGEIIVYLWAKLVPMKKEEENKRNSMVKQSNNVTFGQYDISSTQENIMTAISVFLQPRMTNKQNMLFDMINNPSGQTDLDVTINCDEVAGKNNKKRVIKEAKSLMDKKFSFRWQVPGSNQDVETTGVVVSTIHDFKGTNQVKLSINRWAIPYLIYYGKGVGGTFFSKEIALSLRGKYAKRIYKILSSQRDRAVFEYSIKQFRADFEVPANYDNAHIKSKILNPAKKAIDASDSDVSFDYEFKVKSRKNTVTKPEADTIVFHIVLRHSIPLFAPSQATQEKQLKASSKDYSYCYTWMQRVSGEINDPDVLKCVDAVQASGRMQQFVQKIQYYDDQLAAGNCKMLYVRNTLAKILREDYGAKITVHKG